MLREITKLKESIKSSIRIEDFLRLDGLKLESKGNNYKMLCPFHDDHDPSVVVSVGRQEWRCWPCSDGGDVIDFVQKYHGYSFREALIYIATKSKMDISKFTVRQEEMTPEELRYSYAIKAYKEFAAWCHKNLRIDDISFFSNRGVGSQTLEDFQIGYCENTFAAKNAFSSELLMTVNVLKDNKWNDMAWTNVLVYPIFNEEGEIVSFHNRRYDGNPKYVGTDTNQRLQVNVPYGLFQAKKNAHGKFLIVEGCNDTLAAHNAGFTNTIGAMTDNLSDAYFKKFASLKIKKVTWVPDGDRAGMSSLSKVPNVSNGVQVTVNSLPDGLDPDEFIHTRGRAEFQKVIDGAVLPIEYVISRYVLQYPHQSVTEKISILQALSGNMVGLPPLEYKLACKHIAGLMDVDASYVEDYYAPKGEGEQKLYDQDLERVVLSSMIVDKECLMRVVTMLASTDFYLNRHIQLFKILMGLADQVGNGVISSINYEILNAEINRLGMGRLFDNGQFLTGFLYEKKPDNFDFAVEAVKKHSWRRHLVAELEKFKRQAVDPNREIADVVAESLASISKVTTEQTTSVVPIEGVVSRWVETLYARIENKGEVAGLKIGKKFKNLNYMLGGLAKDRMIMVGGDAGVGKTNVALDFLNEVSDDHRSLYISTEMLEDQLMDRLIAKMSGVSAEKIGLGIGLDERELQAIRMAAVKAYEMKERFVCSTGLTIGEILSIIRHEKLKSGIEAAFVDYAQRITVPGVKPNELYARGVEISGKLKDLTLELHMPVILLVQLDRSSHQDTTPNGGQVAESYRYRQDADQFLVISKKSQKQIENGGGLNVVGNSHIFVDKNRFGKDGVLLHAMFSPVDLTWREMLSR